MLTASSIGDGMFFSASEAMGVRHLSSNALEVAIIAWRIWCLRLKCFGLGIFLFVVPFVASTVLMTVVKKGCFNESSASYVVHRRS